MSSLAAARADNFYYPPEYRPEHGSINKFMGSHPLGDRAKKISEGILVIRFEMPFKVWCLGCNCIVAKGVRFNAEKKCVGNYFTTKIWEFKMTCYHCPCVFVIRTDPQSCEYLVIEGIRRKVEEYDAKDACTIEFADQDERAAREANPMYRLEKIEVAESVNKSEQRRMISLMEISDTNRADDYAFNSALRKQHRERKAEIQRQKVAEDTNFVVPIVPEWSEDRHEAARVNFCSNNDQIARQLRRARLKNGSIFSSSSSKHNGRLSKSSIARLGKEGGKRKRRLTLDDVAVFKQSVDISNRLSAAARGR